MLNRFGEFIRKFCRYADKLSGYIQIFWDVIRTNWVFGAGWRLRRLGRIGVLGRVFSMSLLRTAFAFLIGGLLSGCVSTPHPNHHHQGKVPPRLVVLWLHPESLGQSRPTKRRAETRHARISIAMISNSFRQDSTQKPKSPEASRSIWAASTVNRSVIKRSAEPLLSEGSGRCAPC
jgi:hypothetical protein